MKIIRENNKCSPWCLYILEALFLRQFFRVAVKDLAENAVVRKEAEK